MFQCCLDSLCVLPLRSITCLISQPGFHTTAMILSSIVQCIYAIRPEQTRTLQFQALEGALDNWLLGLPEHLRYDPTTARFNGGPARLLPPNVLTLHMKYWCAVILLHRPFISHLSSAKGYVRGFSLFDGVVMVTVHCFLCLGTRNQSPRLHNETKIFACKLPIKSPRS